jgi:hypothetical protein
MQKRLLKCSSKRMKMQSLWCLNKSAKTTWSPSVYKASCKIEYRLVGNLKITTCRKRLPSNMTQDNTLVDRVLSKAHARRRRRRCLLACTKTTSVQTQMTKNPSLKNKKQDKNILLKACRWKCAIENQRHDCNSTKELKNLWACRLQTSNSPRISKWRVTERALGWIRNSFCR